MSDEQSHPLYQKPEPIPNPDEPQAAKAKQVLITLPGVVQKPYLSYILIAINVALFLVRYLAPDLSDTILTWGYSNTAIILHEKEFYRLFTSMFLHLNETHLLFNMMALYYIGGYVERMFGHLRFGLIYFLAGILGSILPLFVSDAGLGASGAIFGIWGAEAVFLYRHRQLFGAAGQARLKNSLVLMGMNFVFGILVNLAGNATGSSVAIGNAAHLGGAIGGAILAWFVAPRFLVKRKETLVPNEVPVEVLQVNPLAAQVTSLLVYAIALASLLLVASLLRA